MTIYDMHSDVHVRLERGEPIFDIKLNGKAELNSVIPVLKAKRYRGSEGYRAGRQRKGKCSSEKCNPDWKEPRG